MGCDIHPYAEVLTDSGWRKADVKVPSDRNYWAFAVMADVRNGSGFAGCDTGKPVTPISQPRGLPEDTSIEEYEPEKEEDWDSEDYCWLGDHSYSWLLLSELMAVNQDTPIERHAMFKNADAEEWRKTGKLPERWCAWTNQTGYEHVTFISTIRDSAPLIQKMIDALSHLGEPSKVRIVFGFDS